MKSASERPAGATSCEDYLTPTSDNDITGNAVMIRSVRYIAHSPRESVEVFFLPAFVLCVCVCVRVYLSVTTITKKIVDGFIPNLWEGS